VGGKIVIVALSVLLLLAGIWAVYGAVQMFRISPTAEPYVPAVIIVPMVEVEEEPAETPPQVYQIDDMVFFVENGHVHSRMTDGRHVATFGAEDVEFFEIELPWLIFWQFESSTPLFYNMDTGEIFEEVNFSP